MAGNCVSTEKKWYEAHTIRWGMMGLTLGLAAGLLLGAAGAGGGMVFGFLLGMCLSRSFGRLKRHSYMPEVYVTGIVDEQWRNLGAYVPPLALLSKWFGIGAMEFFERDGDWLFNLIILDEQKSYLLTEAHDGEQAYVRHRADCTPFLHCEISSNEGPFGCYGSVIGAAIGAGISAALLGPLAASCGGWGPFAWVCLLLVAFLALLLTYACSAVGGAIGSVLGAAADAIEGQGQIGESLQKGDCVTFCGEWVTDMDHGWNELHDLLTIQIHKDVAPFSLDSCLRRAGLRTIASIE